MQELLAFIHSLLQQKALWKYFHRVFDVFTACFDSLGGLSKKPPPDSP